MARAGKQKHTVHIQPPQPRYSHTIELFLIRQLHRRKGERRSAGGIRLKFAAEGGCKSYCSDVAKGRLQSPKCLFMNQKQNNDGHPSNEKTGFNLEKGTCALLICPESKLLEWHWVRTDLSLSHLYLPWIYWAATAQQWVSKDKPQKKCTAILTDEICLEEILLPSL